jgi:Na+/H+-dicarboxylate symporter
VTEAAKPSEAPEGAAPAPGSESASESASGSASASEPAPAPAPGRFPLYAQVIVAVVLGATLGAVFGSDPYLGGLRNEHLGQLGLLVIKLLKALAVPLIFFAVLDAFVRTSFSWKQGGKLLLICLANVSVAMLIGLAIMRVWQPGLTWRGKISELLLAVPESQQSAEKLLEASHKGTLSPLENLATYIPRSLVDPFSENNVISIVLFALFFGAALRRVRSHRDPEAKAAVATLERFIEAVYRIFVQMLEWVVLAVPFAVFGVLAQVVGKAGLGVFSVLWTFLAAILLGLAIHALVYYPLVAWVIGKKPPRVYLGRGVDAIVTALSCNSSLATVPVTLRCLARMNVSPESSRLAACVGTNLNNDGITLYEAMAALFLAQAVGFDLPLAKQLLIVLASIMAGAGVAGIPEAGLVVLPLVLSAAGLPEQVIAAAIPLIMTVDWIIARCRSGVNVMSDMVVAVLLDARR